MKQVIASLRSGNWKALLACFLYFDTGFTAWVMFGPLAPYVSKQLSLSPTQAGFLVAVPVLSASIVRVTLGNLFQSVDGRRLALLGISISAIPSLILLFPFVPTYSMLLMLGALLGIGGASFAIALPMAGSSYPPRVQGLVLGLAAAGNIGAVVDGFVFPTLAQHFGWQHVDGGRAAAACPHGGGRDAVGGRSQRQERQRFARVCRLRGLIAERDGAGAAGERRIVRPWKGGPTAAPGPRCRRRACRAAAQVSEPCSRERDTWVVMLVYSITFGGFVGMSSYVSLLLTTQYELSKVDAGMIMAGLSFTGAMVRPVGGLLADRLSGVKVLLVLLLAIALCNIGFAMLMPPLPGAVALLVALYLCFGLGNGATFQLVPHRWKGKTGLMTGIIGAAGGIGGFYLPVVMGMAKESTGSYQLGFTTFGILAALAFALVVVLHRQWLAWSAPDMTGWPLDVAIAPAD